MRATLEELLAHGVKRILIVGPTPDMGKDIAKCVAQAERQGVDVNKTCGSSAPALAEARKTYALLAQATEGLVGVRLIDSLPSS
jgi:hypothetical protein